MYLRGISIGTEVLACCMLEQNVLNEWTGWSLRLIAMERPLTIRERDAWREVNDVKRSCLICLQACAPRYIWFSVSQQKYDPEDNRWNKDSPVGSRREPVGTCWAVSNNFNESQEYSPCRTSEFIFIRPTFLLVNFSILFEII